MPHRTTLALSWADEPPLDTTIRRARARPPVAARRPRPSYGPAIAVWLLMQVASLGIYASPPPQVIPLATWGGLFALWLGLAITTYHRRRGARG